MEESHQPDHKAYMMVGAHGRVGAGVRLTQWKEASAAYQQRTLHSFVTSYLYLATGMITGYQLPISYVHYSSHDFTFFTNLAIYILMYTTGP